VTLLSSLTRSLSNKAAIVNAALAEKTLLRCAPQFDCQPAIALDSTLPLTLATGTRLGRYEIRSKLGEGGMGEVYRARDEKLSRDVAIKVLPADFSTNSDRLHRFEQEAQAAGALNHPNILAVYDVGTHDSAPYVVSELLEGETLREALNHRTLATRKAIEYAVQLAQGLAAAHDKGIIHRDLKPDNIFITREERVKILDFGLAKLSERAGTDVAQTEIETRKVRTDPGTVMGTVGYMSPEQVRGQTVDHRTDIFSFGAVLYEMLSGRRAFRGDSAIETLNAILKEEPAELTSSSPNVAPALERVVWHCLEKSPERRFQSAGDIAFALEPLSGVTSQPTGQTTIALTPRSTLLTRERLIWAGVCALLFVTSLVLTFAYFLRTKTSTHAVRLMLTNPDKTTFPAHVTISPDGLRVVFIARNGEGKQGLWVRALDSLTAQPLASTEGAASPFWSPDSRFIGYFANGKLFKIDAAGGRPQAICDVGEDRGGAWNRDGVILFGGPEGLHRVSALGGTPALATRIDSKEEAHRWPYFLPDGRHFVFLADAETTENHHIRLGSLDSQESQVLFGAVTRIAYAPPGYLLYISQGALVAQPFDADKLKVTGDPTTIAEHIAEIGDNHEFDFSVSDNGVLAYQSGSPNSQLVWFDREGKKLAPVGESDAYASIALSPDGRRTAAGLFDADGRFSDIWLFDLAREGSKSRLTFDPQSDGDPIWSPDGTRIVFDSNRAGDGHTHLYLTSAGGAGDDQRLTNSDSDDFPTSWSRDGQSILITCYPRPTAHPGIWLVPLSGDRQPKPLLQSAGFDQTSGTISPDNRFIAYASNESGRLEVYVQTNPLSGRKWTVSSEGGGYPIWRNDGKEIFFITGDGKVMSAEIKPGTAFESGIARQLFQTKIKINSGGYPYAVTADGGRFLIKLADEADKPASMVVVLNWMNDLKR
jgi:serine/threonine protein kinase/Tol biopolymer transport system component